MNRPLDPETLQAATADLENAQRAALVAARTRRDATAAEAKAAAEALNDLVVTTYEQGPLKAGHIREAAGMKESWFYRLLKERRDAAGTS